jgi:hypothetical protein
VAKEEKGDAYMFFQISIDKSATVETKDEVLLAGRGRRAFTRHRACGGCGGWTQCCRCFDASDYIPNRVLCEKFSECPKIRRYSSHVICDRPEDVSSVTT